MTKYALFVLCTALLVSCAPIQQTISLSQPTNIQLTAGVGDMVLNVSKEKNLPNVFGRSSIYGRKTPTGMTTVQYLGVRNGKAIFRRKSILIETGATTMNNPIFGTQNSSTTTHSGEIGGTSYSGTSTTPLPPTQPSKAQILDQSSMEISVDLAKKQRELVVEGRTLRIESADSTKLVYSILD